MVADSRGIFLSSSSTRSSVLVEFASVFDVGVFWSL